MKINKKIVILTIIFLLVIILVCIAFGYIKKERNNEKGLEDHSLIYDKDGNIVYNLSSEKEVLETIEDTTIQGIVELNHNGYIYIFNGQHFGEYGFEMQEYTRANIDNKNQECIDYHTLEKYDTSYIQEGDIIICTGDLKKYSMRDNDLDTKENPIIVLKSKDYNTIKKETLNNNRKSTITIGEYFDNNGEIYIKYEIADKEYNLPFVLKLKVTDDTQVIGNLKKGNKIIVQYKDLNVPIDELELKRLEVVKE